MAGEGAAGKEDGGRGEAERGTAYSRGGAGRGAGDGIFLASSYFGPGLEQWDFLVILF
jgi:hypothetical protein